MTALVETKWIVANNLCKLRYKRHHRTRKYTVTIPMSGNYSTDQRSDNMDIEGAPKYKTGSFPQQEDNCTVISWFLSNSSNLELIHNKAEYFGCMEGVISNMFYRLSKLTDTNTIGRTRRVKILRKWRQLGCGLYRHILDCVKQTLPSRNTTDLRQVCHMLQIKCRIVWRFKTNLKSGLKHLVYLYDCIISSINHSSD